VERGERCKVAAGASAHRLVVYYGWFTTGGGDGNVIEVRV
jgi:hypothetical protein